MAGHLLASGAEGETRAQLLTALHNPASKLSDDYRKYFDDIDPVLNWGQRLFARPGVPLGRKFLEQAREHYATEVVPLVDQAAIDDWVKRSTSGKVPSLAFESLDGVSLLLLNCLDLKIAWREPFKVEDTHPEPFHGAGWTRQVPTMEQQAEMLYAQATGYRVLELPYQQERFAFDCILPDHSEGLGDLEKNLDWAKLAATLARLEPTSIHLRLPRFQINFRQDFEPALKTLGIRRAFDSEAQFTPINPSLHLSGVTQQGWVRINEEGTEAAAVTEMMMASGTPEPALEFRVDHPFLFLLRDKTTGMILLLGRVADPEQ